MQVQRWKSTGVFEALREKAGWPQKSERWVAPSMVRTLGLMTARSSVVWQCSK